MGTQHGHFGGVQCCFVPHSSNVYHCGSILSVGCRTLQYVVSRSVNVTSTTYILISHSCEQGKLVEDCGDGTHHNRESDKRLI